MIFALNQAANWRITDETELNRSAAVQPKIFLVPPEKNERTHIRECVQDYAREQHIVPPLSLAELSVHAQVIVNNYGTDAQYSAFITVLLNNYIWEEIVAAVPYQRRILLLPQCLRNKDQCPAAIDEFGLLCEQCGRCATGSLQAFAENLGYVVLIAEGTTVVTKLLESSQVDCVIGVSCLSSLERSFPLMLSAAIPGIAIPLVKNGCNCTQVDIEWVQHAIQVTSARKWEDRFNLDQLKIEVRSWFTREAITSMLQLKNTKTERIACNWLIKDGKRWRPFLAASVFQALEGHKTNSAETIKKLAIAIECFHKASLVHDDIEDDDDYRYGMKTVHKKYGIPMAINIGDLLLGEGYRLIAECGASANQIGQMLSIAASGHRTLCLGQGEELGWLRHPASLSTAKVLHIFRQKTAPAFEVALTLGAIAAGANAEVCSILHHFSQALGIAYQIRDDIEDVNIDDHHAVRGLSLMWAMVNDDLKYRAAVENIGTLEATLAKKIVHELKLEEKAWQLFDHFRNEAIHTLQPLRHYPLKSLLFRMVHRILGDTPDLPKAQEIQLTMDELNSAIHEEERKIVGYGD